MYHACSVWSVPGSIWRALDLKPTLIAKLLKNPPAMQETQVQFLGQNICWRRNGLPTPGFLCFPCGLAAKESACNVGDMGSIPGLGRSPGEGKGYPLQYSGLENCMDYTVHGVPKSGHDWATFTFHIMPSIRWLTRDILIAPWSY